MSVLPLRFWLRGLTNYNATLSAYSSCHFQLLKSCKKIINNVITCSVSSNNNNINNDGNEANKTKKFVAGGGNLEKKVLPGTIKILLLNENGEKSVLYLEQAEKIAKRSNAKLINLGEVAKKPMYKLVKFGKNVTKAETKEKLKKIYFGAQISEHDIELKISQLHKLLQKKKSVHVVIEKHTTDSDKHSLIFGQIQKKVGPEINISDVRDKSSVKAFTLKPAVTNSC